MPPDEWNKLVNNSAFTNAVAKWSLLLPEFVGKLTNTDPDPRYKEIADRMYIPYDKQVDYHPEFDDYAISEISFFSIVYDAKFVLVMQTLIKEITAIGGKFPFRLHGVFYFGRYLRKTGRCCIVGIPTDGGYVRDYKKERPPYI